MVVGVATIYPESHRVERRHAAARIPRRPRQARNQPPALSQVHKKIILYGSPGTAGFYGQLGFLRMNTA